MNRIIIIGGGAAGMFCAIKLKEELKNDIIVLEANKEPLKKLLATGNGRCNLSNKDMDMRHYEGEITPAIKHIIRSFDDQKELAEEGLLTKYIGNLLYPYSEQAKSVAELFLKRAAALKIKIITDQPVTRICYDKKYHILTNSHEYTSDVLVLAMGSQAGKLSTTIDRQKVINGLLPWRSFAPTLTQFYTSPVYKELKGVRVKGQFTLINKDGQKHSEEGELLFTDYGVSGIAVMSLSRFYQPGAILHIDMMKEYSEIELNAIYHHSPLDEPLTGLVNTKIARLLKDQKDPLHFLKHMTLKVTGLRDYSYAQAMKGGIVVRSLDDDLASKKYPQLYVIGELLNVTGDCGGYNLHFALASATRVARAIERNINA